MKALPSSSALILYGLHDQRLNKRLGVLCEQLSQSVGLSTPATIQNNGQTKAYYRFVNNKKVTPSALTEGYGLYSRENSLPHDTILAIQDTTTLNYTSKRSAAHLDCLESAYTKGFMLHNHLLVNSLGCPIGLFSQSFFARKEEGLGVDKVSKRKKKPITAKESYRWLQEFNALQDAYESHHHLTVIQICDREADIHEVLQARRCENVHYIIRSAYDRACAGGGDNIWQQTAQSTVAYEYTLNVPAGKNRTTRIATMEVKYQQVTIKAGYRKEKNLHPQAVWVLSVKEISPVAQGEDPIHWHLLTSIPITDTTIAAQIIQYYVFRWLIERFHYVLKQGLNAEELQIKDKNALQNAIILKSWMAIDVMLLEYLPLSQPTLTLQEAGFSELDYQIALEYAQKCCRSKEEKQEKPLVIHFTRIIAQIGGHSLQKSKTIGIVSIWRGWNTFCIIKKTFFNLKIPMTKNVGNQ